MAGTIQAQTVDIDDLEVEDHKNKKNKERQEEYNSVLTGLAVGGKRVVVHVPETDTARSIKLRLSRAATRLGITVEVGEGKLKATGETVVTAKRTA